MRAISLILMAIPGKWRGIRIFRCSMMGVFNFRSKGSRLLSETMQVRETIDRHTQEPMGVLCCFHT